MSPCRRCGGDHDYVLVVIGNPWAPLFADIRCFEKGETKGAGDGIADQMHAELIGLA